MSKYYKKNMFEMKGEIKNCTYEKVQFVDNYEDKIIFINCTFKDCLFRECDLTAIEFHDCTFINCKIPKTVFDVRLMTHCEFDLNLKQIKYYLKRKLHKHYEKEKFKFLLKRINEGKIRGQVYYDGECGCLLGTLALKYLEDNYDSDRCSKLLNSIGYAPNESSLTERFVRNIEKGDTPKNSYFSAQLEKWVKEVIDEKNK